MNSVYKCINPIIKFAETGKTALPTKYDTAIVLSLTVMLAICVKLFYSTAGPVELKWILYPTSALVNVFSSIEFWFDPNKGYMAVGTPVVIGPGCAGLNYFVIALCMSVFSFANRYQHSKVYLFLGLTVLTYVVTLVANASRIIAVIMMLDLGDRLNFTVSSTLHTVQGSLFYFVFLVAYFVALQVLFNKRRGHETVH